MANLYSIIGVDGSGKDFWLQECFRHLPGGSGFYPLPCTHYHLSPYCGAPALSRLLYKLGARADQEEDAALKAMSLFLKMMMFSAECRHLESRFGASTILSTRHPAIDTVVYSRLFLRHIPLGRPAEENHLLRARKLLEEEEWLQLEAFLKEVGSHGSGGSLEALILAVGRRSVEEQIRAYAHIFGAPLPGRILFLNPDIRQVQQNLRGREGAAPEIHERAAYLETLRQEFRSCLDAAVNIAPRMEVKEIVHTLDPESRREILAFLTD